MRKENRIVVGVLGDGLGKSDLNSQPLQGTHDAQGN